MRHAIVFVAVAIVALIADARPGNARPFCLISSVNLGIPDCTYHTWAQCRAAIGGGGDACELNRNGLYVFDVSNPGNPRVVSPLAPRRKVRGRRY